jgi:hypothetical protein
MAVPDWADPVADDQPKPVEEMAEELDAETETLEEKTREVESDR